MCGSPVCVVAIVVLDEMKGIAVADAEKKLYSRMQYCDENLCLEFLLLKKCECVFRFLDLDYFTCFSNVYIPFL
jgi:hypothetical protein